MKALLNITFYLIIAFMMTFTVVYLIYVLRNPMYSDIFFQPMLYVLAGGFVSLVFIQTFNK
jgi:hypothetical protein